jgi:hypothetical protein
MEVVSSDVHLAVGGVASNIVWDPTGSRFAVSVEGSTHDLQVYSYCGQAFRHTGVCLGPSPGSTPLAMQFSPEFSNGSAANAVLTVLWSDKVLAHYPFIF